MNLPISLLALLATGLLAPPAGLDAIDEAQPRLAISDVDQGRDRSVVVGNAAVLGGRLAVVGNCVVVKQESGDYVLPIFPSGIATWDGRARQLRYFNDTYAVGDPVALGGGFADEAMIAALRGSDDVDIPADCPTSEVWVAIG